MDLGMEESYAKNSELEILTAVEDGIYQIQIIKTLERSFAYHKRFVHKKTLCYDNNIPPRRIFFSQLQLHCLYQCIHRQQGEKNTIMYQPSIPIYTERGIGNCMDSVSMNKI